MLGVTEISLHGLSLNLGSGERRQLSSTFFRDCPEKGVRGSNSRQGMKRSGKKGCVSSAVAIVNPVVPEEAASSDDPLSSLLLNGGAPVSRARPSAANGSPLQLVVSREIEAAQHTGLWDPDGLGRVTSELESLSTLAAREGATETRLDLSTMECYSDRLCDATSFEAGQEEGTHDEPGRLPSENEFSGEPDVVEGITALRGSRKVNFAERVSMEQALSSMGDKGMPKGSRDRESTPVARALAFCLRGVQTVQEVEVILSVQGEAMLTLGTVTSCMRKLGLEGNTPAALALLQWMRTAKGKSREVASGQNLRPNVFTYNGALAAMRHNREWDGMDEVSRWMREDGVIMDTVTLNVYLSAYLDRGMVDTAWEVLGNAMRNVHAGPDLFTVRTMAAAVLSEEDAVDLGGSEAGAQETNEHLALGKAWARMYLLLDCYSAATSVVVGKGHTKGKAVGHMKTPTDHDSQRFEGRLLTPNISSSGGRARTGVVRSRTRQQKQHREIEAFLCSSCNEALRALLVHVQLRQKELQERAELRPATLNHASVSSKPAFCTEAAHATGKLSCCDHPESHVMGAGGLTIDLPVASLGLPEGPWRSIPEDDSFNNAPSEAFAMKPRLLRRPALTKVPGSSRSTGQECQWVVQARELLSRMRAAGVSPDGATFYWVLRVLCLDPKGQQRHIRVLYKEMRDRKYLPDSRLCTCIIAALGTAKRWWASLEVYEDMLRWGPQPTPETEQLVRGHFHFLLNAGRKRRLWKWALQLVERMKGVGLEPGEQAWRTVLVTCATANQTEAAVQVFKRMVDAGHRADEVAYGALLSALEKGAQWAQAEDVWRHMVRLGLGPNLQAYTTMIAALGKQGLYGRAVELFEEMQRERGIIPDLAAYNALISACAVAGEGTRALAWIKKMEEMGVKPSSASYEQAALALCNEGQWEASRSVLAAMGINGCVPSLRCEALLQSCMEHLLQDTEAQGKGLRVPAGSIPA